MPQSDFDKDCEKYGYIPAFFHMQTRIARRANPERYEDGSEQDRIFEAGGDEALIPHQAKPLYGALWFEGEMACMFGDTNIGKSAFAYQIACYVAEQTNLRVGYFDFENMQHHYIGRY